MFGYAASVDAVLRHARPCGYALQMKRGLPSGADRGDAPKERGRRTSGLLAWLLGLVAVGLIAGALWLSARGPGEQSGLFGAVTMGLVTVGFSTVGALVVSRHPSNLIGWIFSGVGLISAANGFAEAYARRAFVVAPGSLANGALAVWAQNWLWIPLIGVTATFSLLLFPDGRLPSRRWRPIVWTSTAAIAATTFGFFAGPLEDELTESIATYANPAGLTGTAGRAAEVLGLIGFGLLLGSALASIASLVTRFRHASQMQRQQIKWFAFGGSVLGLTVVVGSALWQVSPVARLLVPASLLLAPASAGIAILKYRLYDIDRIINRTLVYGALTAALGLAYLGIVTLLQQLLRPLTGTSDLAVAGSTLVVAALFRPARAGVQAFIDRRFFRHKYDAVQTSEAFSARLREEIELERLSQELLAVVRKTMQPAHLSLWLRDAQRSDVETLPRSRSP
jgi:hypothetical protein